MKLYQNKAFKSRQDKRVMKMPDIDGVEMQKAVEKTLLGPFSGRATLFSLLEKDPYGGICEVIYGIRTLASSKKTVIQKHFVIPENTNRSPLIRNAYYRYGGMAAGVWTYGYDGKGKSLGYYNPEFEYSGAFDYIDPDFPTERIYATQAFITSKTIADLDPALKYNSYRSNCGIRALAYIRLYRKYPQSCEMLMKMELFSFITPVCLERMKKDEGFARWVARNRDLLRSISPQTAYCSYRKDPNLNPQKYNQEIRRKKELGRLISIGDKKVYKKVLSHTTRESVASYLVKKNISPSCYNDYLVACNWLRLDFSDTKVLFPHDFASLHDNYTRQYAEYKAEKERKEMCRKARLLSQGMAKTAKRFSFLGTTEGNFCVIIPTDKMQLITEGEALHHCVGRMGYDKKMAEGESVIVFIRQPEDIEKSFVTAEVKVCDKTLKVAQCYGKDNSEPSDDVKTFVEQWITEANKTFKKSA